jgi:steroid 5-alpha reductase family enzyme
MTNSALGLVLSGWFLMALLLAGLWLIQKIRQEAGLVDVVWSTRLGILAIFFYGDRAGYPPRRFPRQEEA